ncbi:MAG: hypothetical protein PHX04_05165 [Bacilli bacterium]|nr:hypothetical protein [Bacilli bacterium]
MKNRKKENLFLTKDIQSKRNKRNKMFFLIFLTAILLMASTYAWLSSSLNVKIQFLKLGVASNSGLYISLDGVDFSESVTISMDSIIMDIKENYPNHTNQWSYALWPVSSNGIKNTNQDKFSFYTGDLVHTKERNPNGSVKRLLNTFLRTEDSYHPGNLYVAFDIFLKNATGSPNADNLYFSKTTQIDYDEDTDEELKLEMDGILNSIRIGLVKIGSVPLLSDISDIQNVKCNSACEMLIYEPYSKSHSEASIETALNYGVQMLDGIETPTYGIIAEGTRLEHTNGHFGTGLPLNTTYFKLQETVKDFTKPVFKVPNAITKARVYIWIEGQDIDSLETNSKGTDLIVSIDFEKDMAGYE